MKYINERKINYLLNSGRKPIESSVRIILKKAVRLKGLSLDEVSVLLNVNDQMLLEQIFKTARMVKDKIYGDRLVIFAPLYLTNYCVNNCLYCGFRKDNKELVRKILTKKEIIEEVKSLLAQGHKRILLVLGEDIQKAGIDYVSATIRTIYSVRYKGASIRRINVNTAPLEKDDFAVLKKANIGTYQLFQETYHADTYKKMHPSGPKKDFNWRISAFDRAMEAGLDDLGIGVLFGLYDWRFEVLALLMHVQGMEKKFGIGPHTISIPRVEPALNAPAANNPPFPVSDMDFKKIISILRLAVPYTGIILTTREKAELRNELFFLGVSQISASSRTFPGAYKMGSITGEKMQQFTLGDMRSLEEVIYHIMQDDFIPSFCTSCYRLGRTGRDFMELAKPGLIQEFCLPNALFTFKEYLEDYSSKKVKNLGSSIIKKKILEIKDKNVQSKTKKQIQEIEEGKRDVYL